MNLLEEAFISSFLKDKSDFSKTEASIVHIICKKWEVDKVKQHTNTNRPCSPYNCLLKKHLNGFTKLGTIVSLTLCRCNLHTLPNCLSKFNIRELNLSDNNFIEVPESLINCRKLEKLDLSRNNLLKFDTEPAFVQRLRYLNLEENAMTDIPEWVLNVRSFNLEELYYSHNKVEGFSNAKFHKVSHYELQKLVLQNCYLMDEDLKFLKSIRTLRSLNISNNKVHVNLNKFTKCDDLFSKPSWYNTIIILRLNNLQLSMLPPEINSFTSLEELEISENNLLWLPEQLCNLKKLKLLDVSNNSLISLPESLSKLKSLQTLKAANNQIATLPSLCLLTNLHYIDLYYNELDTLREINTNFLKYVDLEFNCFFSKDLAWLNINEYENKKTALRYLLSENRTDGSRTVSDCVKDDESLSGYQSDSSSDVVCEDIKYTSDKQYNELENWDDEKSLHSDNGCTESDNEWKGCDKSNFRLTVRQKNGSILKKWPSYLFQDAIE